VDPNYGADGGNVQFAASLQGTNSGKTSGGLPILYDVSNGGHTLTGFVDTNGNGTFQSGTDTTGFTNTPNLDGRVTTPNDTYTVNMIGTVDGGSQTLSFSGVGFNFVGGNDPWAGFIDTTSAHNDLLLTPEVGGLPNSTVNSNATVGGVGSGNSIGAGESIRLDFVNNLTGNTAKSVAGDYGAVPNEDHSFTGHYTVNGAQATFSSTTGSKVSFVAADDVNLDPNGAPGNSVGPNEGNTGFTL